MSEALPYIGAIIGAFTPIGPSWGFAIGPLVGGMVAERRGEDTGQQFAAEETYCDDRQCPS